MLGDNESMVFGFNTYDMASMDVMNRCCGKSLDRDNCIFKCRKVWLRCDDALHAASVFALVALGASGLDGRSATGIECFFLQRS